jgi:hypothetical protein
MAKLTALIFTLAAAIMTSGCASAPPEIRQNFSAPDITGLCDDFAGVYECANGTYKLVAGRAFGQGFSVLSAGRIFTCPPLAPYKLSPECREAIRQNFCEQVNLCESLTEECQLNRCDCRCYKNGTREAEGAPHCSVDCLAVYNVTGCEYQRNRGCVEKHAIPKPRLELLGCSDFAGAMSCTMPYNPVCALTGNSGAPEWVEFGNACSACAGGRNIIGYLNGGCGPRCVNDTECTVNCTGSKLICENNMCIIISMGSGTEPGCGNMRTQAGMYT